MSLSRLLAIDEATLISGGYRKYVQGEGGISEDPVTIAIVTPLAISVGYANGLGLELRDAIWLRDMDLICVRVLVHAPPESRGLRLLVHASYGNGYVIPYDRNLRSPNAFHFSRGKYYADVLIDDASSLEHLEFQLINSGRVLPQTMDGPLAQLSMTVLTQALSPGIKVGIVEALSE